MPSFRTTLTIDGLRPGNAPESVMATAVEALESCHHVEANQLDIVRGVPQLTLRFLVEPTEYDAENRLARESAASVRDAVDRVAVTGRQTVSRRARGKWLVV
ncbi:hypothetical protein ACQR35_10830 [Pseudarthrobacter sp. J1738]|uniref:hypothetical protein n=1 Tax=unclassified Pseudarthrobacter TaxID=2647000 RepID=UPI003D2B56EC